MTPASEIAVLMNIDSRELIFDINDIDNPVHQAFFLGYATTANEMRKQEIEWAKAGSPVAVVKMSDYIRDIQTDLAK